MAGKKYDFIHIIVAELESVLKGVNLALKWGLRDLEVKTDSATVCGWTETIIKEKTVITKGATGMIKNEDRGIYENWFKYNSYNIVI